MKHRTAAASLLILASAAAGPATLPTTAPAADLQRKMLADVVDFQKVYQPSAMPDPAARSAMRATLVPAARQVLSDLITLGNARPQSAAAYRGGIVFYATVLAVYDDPDGRAWIDALSHDGDPRTALLGKGQHLYVRWCQAGGDAAAQGKVVDDATVLADADPTSVTLTRQLMMMADNGAASPALADRLKRVITGKMHNAMADRVAEAMALPARVDKPMAMAGKLVDGQHFTTADWGGKVILVDFWATWCGPCKRELPRVKAAYEKYHGRGLEVLGVSNDYAAAPLVQYAAANAMPWPELFDPASADQQMWHPLTRGYGIDGIPCMFLIDKHGVCRSVTARESMEDLIPKLLAE